ncbi:histidine phosphatase family protein [Limosilactobacillus reuteri]|uniref:histidine phosphatase family protein n=1 Tax=Limosilactobacillus reuteri TaxID=1598 RepID=UPI002B4A1F5B|nr:histidine phosphatase family protein [Limosilactobacillus reuteri]WRH78280.1 histidine phosphatase family protein [Limosilactobacillus reuteri]
MVLKICHHNLKERQHDRRYDRLGVKIPLSESLEMTLQRLLPYWQDHIAPRLIDGHNQLLFAHGSSLRALIKYLDGISDNDIDKVKFQMASQFYIALVITLMSLKRLL